MRVGVVGAGTMGAGIAQVCLQAGHAVTLHDVDAVALGRGRGRIEDGLERLVRKGSLERPARDAAVGRLAMTERLEEVASGADLVIEAALEDLALKRTLMAALDTTTPPPALLASNTSALSIERLAEVTGRPDRVLGLHFFNPAPLMALVEVVSGTGTSAATREAGLAFARGLGKQPIACHDAPGFVVNRVNRPFTLEALRMLEAGEADVAAIDRAVTVAGYPMGPFTLMDLVGVDVNLAVARAIWEGYQRPERFRPSPLQEALVAAGQLGRKTGRGFYHYGEDGRPAGLAPLPGAAVAALQVSREPPLPPDGIVARLELAIINEAYQAAAEGVATPPDIDLALRLGAGHPAGPFERARALGLRAVIDGLMRLEGRYGERYRVAAALWHIASV